MPHLSPAWHETNNSALVKPPLFHKKQHPFCCICFIVLVGCYILPKTMTMLASRQGVTKRCRLFWLTNKRPRIWAQMGGSQPMSTALHRSPNKLWRSNCIFKGTWQWGGFSGVFAEIGSPEIPYTTFRAVPLLASNCGDIRNKKTTCQVGVGFWMFKRKLGETESQGLSESLTPQLGEWESPRLPDLTSRGVPMWFGEALFEFFKI